MTGDWLAAVSALTALGILDDANVSVLAMSMGARFGLRSRPHSDHDCGVP
jgi:hypothetical protein